MIYFLRIWGQEDSISSRGGGIKCSIKMAPADVILWKQGPGEKRNIDLLKSSEDESLYRRGGLDRETLFSRGLGFLRLDGTFCHRGDRRSNQLEGYDRGESDLTTIGG